MQKLSLSGRFSLVTGASSGLGHEIARQIARDHKGNLVLVARRKDKLDALASELRAAHGVEVVTVQADMTDRSDVDRTFAEATAGRTIHAAVLNAGVTYFGHGVEMDLAAFDAMLATNVTAVVHLTQRFVPYFIEKNEGGAAMIVSSMAGLSPTPFQAAYSGTKAFLNNYGMALAEELAGKNVSLTMFVPGGIATEMGEKSGTARKFKKGDVGMMDVDVCARIALQGMISRRRCVVPGALNMFNDYFMRLAPRSMAIAITARIFRDAVKSLTPPASTP